MVNTEDKGRAGYIALIESQGTLGNRYTDLKAIDPTGGGGNFSIVIKARDLQSSKQRRMVALKFFDPRKYTDEYRFNCFAREADILLRLKNQKNILPIIEGRTKFNLNLKSEQGVELPVSFVYYVAPLAESNIKEYIYATPTYLRNILLFREMCKSIQRIHNYQICHRDLKPDNFLIYKKRYVCLSDFGTAKSFIDDQPMLDNYAAPVGDLRYVAPELLCGLHSSSLHVFCADIYSLGAILFESFTKVILGGEIYDQDTRNRLLAHFHTVSENNRQSVFDEIIPDITEKRKLQSVRMYDNTIPMSLAFHIDRLYQGMASLDYRKRLTDFQEIFIKINICEKVIRHQMVLEQRRSMKLRKKILSQENINA